MNSSRAAHARRALLSAALAAGLPRLSGAAGSYSVKVVGGDEASFVAGSTAVALRNPFRYDAVVVGGGLAGLTAAL